MLTYRRHRPINALALSLLLAALLLGSTRCATTGRIQEPTKKEKEKAQAIDNLNLLLSTLNVNYQQSLNSGDQTSAMLLQGRIGRLREEISALIQRAIADYLAKQTGIAAKPREEKISLEALDPDGNVVDIPFTTAVRPLRKLTDAKVTNSIASLLHPEGIPIRLYTNIPDPIHSETLNIFRRYYQAQDAEAIAMEARLVVELKGGLWNTDMRDGVAANAIAIRGLDLDRGLSRNSNTTYDDTLYMILEYPTMPTEVYEYRMTTESSSTKEGVGRLDAKQVTYVRGLHRGKDPAFRLEGNTAKGTRLGKEGEFDIVGANIHSAYTSRKIDSNTPLSPNVSLGCQVIAASQKDFESALINLLDNKKVSRFPYTIVDDTEMTYLNKLLHEKNHASILVQDIPRPSE